MAHRPASDPSATRRSRARATSRSRWATPRPEPVASAPQRWPRNRRLPRPDHARSRRFQSCSRAARLELAVAGPRGRRHGRHRHVGADRKQCGARLCDMEGIELARRPGGLPHGADAAAVRRLPAGGGAREHARNGGIVVLPAAGNAVHRCLGPAQEDQRGDVRVAEDVHGAVQRRRHARVAARRLDDQCLPQVRRVELHRLCERYRDRHRWLSVLHAGRYRGPRWGFGGGAVT